MAPARNEQQHPVNGKDQRDGRNIAENDQPRPGKMVEDLRIQHRKQPLLHHVVEVLRRMDRKRQLVRQAVRRNIPSQHDLIEIIFAHPDPEKMEAGNHGQKPDPGRCIRKNPL